MLRVCGLHLNGTTMNIAHISISRKSTYLSWITKSVIPKTHFSPTSLFLIITQLVLPIEMVILIEHSLN